MAILSPRRRRSIEAFIVVTMMSSCVLIILLRILIPVYTGNPIADDKTLEMMLNLWFGGGAVTVWQFFFGSSQGSRDKDEAKEDIDAVAARNPAPVIVQAPPLAPDPAAAPSAPASPATPAAPPGGGPFRTSAADLRAPRASTLARTSDPEVLEPAAPNPPR